MTGIAPVFYRWGVRDPSSLDPTTRNYYAGAYLNHHYTTMSYNAKCPEGHEAVWIGTNRFEEGYDRLHLEVNCEVCDAGRVGLVEALSDTRGQGFRTVRGA